MKGVCILFVVLTHCLPLQEYMLFSLWGAQVVPLFLLLQVFHAYKRGVNHISLSYDFKKMFHRIFKPFILLIVIQLILLLFLKQHSLITTIKSIILSGGIGPGSYYVWIYVQFFLILPLVAVAIQRIMGYLLFIFISALFEVAFAYIHIPASLYRLLAIRYLFLIYLGYMWVIRGIEINKKTVILSFISIFFILIFEYTDINLEPLFFNNDWAIFHWICYFYVAYLFVYLLYKVYQQLGGYLKSWFSIIGKYSYEIFLLQMFVFTFFPSYECMDFIGNIYLAVLIKIVLTTSLSIYPVLLYKRYIVPKLKLNNNV